MSNNMGHNSKKKSFSSLSSDEKKRVKAMIIEINGSLTRIAKERDWQKESINDLSEELGLDKKQLRRMSKVYFKANFIEEKQFDQDFVESYENILND